MLLTNSSKYALGLLILGVFIAPITLIPLVFDGVGIADWDHVGQRYAAVYLSYIHFGQYPGNNAWIGGGVPLSQLYPGFGMLALFTVLFGPKSGIYIGVGFYYILGYFGAIKLAQTINKSVEQQIYFSLYFVMGNALAWHLSVGHVIFLNILLVPLLIVATCNYRGKYNGLIVGLLLGVTFLDGFSYTNQYIIGLVAIIIIYLFCKNETNRKQLTNFVLQLTLTFLTITFYRISSIIPIMMDYPRLLSHVTEYTWYDFAKFAVIPFADNTLNVTSGKCSGVWENANYIGIIPALICLYCVLLKRKLIYFAPFLFLILSFSNDTNWYDFNYYLKLIPTFGSHGCTARIRLFTPLVFGLVLLSACNFLEESNNVCKRLHFTRWIWISIILEMFVISSIPLYQSHGYKGDKKIVWRSEFQNYANLPTDINSLTAATLSNIGILKAQDSNLPADRVAQGKEQVNYLAEFSQDGQKVTPFYWSPNRIIFQLTNTQDCVKTNIPIGNLWSVNGIDIYKNEKVVDFSKLICAFPDDKGRIEISWKVRNHELLLGVNLLIALASLAYFFKIRFAISPRRARK